MRQHSDDSQFQARYYCPEADCGHLLTEQGYCPRTGKYFPPSRWKNRAPQFRIRMDITPGIRYWIHGY